MLIYNTYTREKEEFKPIEENKVKMYICGPTVYNYIHIGNARPVLFFDLVHRYFKYLGYEVEFVSNVTDVDDKIINRAIEEEVTEAEIAEKYLNYFLECNQLLNALPFTSMPKVTENMDEMIQFIHELVERGFAYAVDGDVYFRIDKVREYGQLSGKKIEELEVGARIAEDSKKENPLDFVLWKKTDKGITWDSPWGAGRPGWHTECVVMIGKEFGGKIDIHGGGTDLQFPHHENEIAQSEALTGKKFANYWMHAAFLNVNNQKMSKSLNNFLTARDALKEYDADVIRFLMLSGHYRIQLNFSNELLESAKASIERLYNAIGNLENLISEVKNEKMTDEEIKYLESLDTYRQRYIEKMDDDFNTADAISVLFDLIRDTNSNIGINSSKELCEKALELIRELGLPLGILQKTTKGDLEAEIEALIAERQQARKDRNFALADKIRDDLKAKGIELLDTPQGVRWKKVD